MTLRRFASYLLWPTLFASALLLTWMALNTAHGVLLFNFIYLGLAAVIGVLERLMPHEETWLENDRQTLANLAHTLLNKGLIQFCLAFSALIGIAAYFQPAAGTPAGVWPESWPLVFQVLLGLFVAEFGLYWAHRLSHEIPLLWRFHAVHHSVTRLWFINTGRFHFVDTIFSVALSQPLLYLLDAPLEVFLWVAAVTAFIGMLTHCNIEMRTGVFNYLCNTPGLHRWHHSMLVEEGNTNYGENLMIWDLLFGTFYNPERRPPAVIGITSHMPAEFYGQLAHPFRRGALAELPPPKPGEARR